MRHFILMSHGYLARGMASSVEMILGEREDISYICAYVDGDADIKDEAAKRIESFGEDAETVILTDIFGGSVNNELLGLMNRKNVYLVSGMNLSLVLELLIRAEDGAETGSIIAECMQRAKEGMRFCNHEFSENSEDIPLDEF